MTAAHLLLYFFFAFLAAVLLGCAQVDRKVTMHLMGEASQ